MVLVLVILGVMQVTYTLECIRETQKDPEARWYGVSFEAAIPMLVHSLGR